MGTTELAHLLDVRLCGIFADPERLRMSVIILYLRCVGQTHLVVLGVVHHGGCEVSLAVISYF